MAKKSKKDIEYEQQIGELTQDLQRTRADFENYRKRVDQEIEQAKESGRMQSVMKLLPLIDTIERGVSHLPDDLKDNAWAKGVVSMSKNLLKLMADLNIEKIIIKPGETEFSTDFHEAISMEDEGGDREIISEELQAGYLMNGQVLRHAMVRVVKK